MKSVEQRVTVVIVSAGAVFLAVLWGVTAAAGQEIVAAVLDGRILTSFGDAVRLHMTNNPKHQSVEYYVDLASAAASRTFFLWTVCGAVLIGLQRNRDNLIGSFFSADADALSLAVTRIVVFAALVDAVHLPAIEQLASQPVEMIQAPRFMSWFVGLVPISPSVAVWAARALIVTGILAAAGALTRYTTVITVILSIYIFGLPQYFGKISHGMHGLLWIAMILAASPCGSALSIDRALGVNSGGSPSPEVKRAPVFGVPIRMIWFLFACIYFFPGVWKFVISGWDWALSDNLKFKMYSAWRGTGYVPAFRIDHYPFVYRSAALVSMLWEIAFPFLILFRRTRTTALVMGAAFHIGVWKFMQIGPPMIMFGYVAFVDWEALLARSRRGVISASHELNASRMTRIVGGAVCGLVFLSGLTLTNSWPFSVYPTHAGIRGPTVQAVEMRVFTKSGRSMFIDIDSVSAVTRQSVDFAVITAPDSAKRNAYLRGLAENWISNHESIPWSVIEFYQTIRILSPRGDDEPPLARDPLFTIVRRIPTVGESPTR